jgi:hypothetical protein
MLCKLRALELRMPIRAYLDRNHRFDGETLRLMGIAFEMALTSHPAAAPGAGDPVREALAQKIIAVAKTGVRDPERLCDAALKAVAPPPGSLPPDELPEAGQAAEG